MDAETKYLNRNSCMVFPGSAGVSPAQEAARMAALPGYKLQEHNGIKIVSEVCRTTVYVLNMNRPDRVRVRLELEPETFLG